MYLESVYFVHKFFPFFGYFKVMMLHHNWVQNNTIKIHNRSNIHCRLARRNNIHYRHVGRINIHYRLIGRSNISNYWDFITKQKLELQVCRMLNFLPWNFMQNLMKEKPWALQLPSLICENLNFSQIQFANYSMCEHWTLNHHEHKTILKIPWNQGWIPLCWSILDSSTSIIGPIWRVQYANKLHYCNNQTSYMLL